MERDELELVCCYIVTKLTHKMNVTCVRKVIPLPLPPMKQLSLLPHKFTKQRTLINLTLTYKFSTYLTFINKRK